MSDPAAALRELSLPWIAGDKVKAQIARAAKSAGLSYWRAFDIWYGKARRIPESERRRIAEAVEHKRKQAARNEMHELRLRVARIEVLLERALAHLDRSSPSQDRKKDRDPD